MCRFINNALYTVFVFIPRIQTTNTITNTMHVNRLQQWTMVAQVLLKCRGLFEK